VEEKMKKLIVLLTAAVLIMALAGCGKKAEEQKTQAPAAGEGTPLAQTPAATPVPPGGEAAPGMPPTMGGQGAEGMPGGLPPMAAKPAAPKQVVVPDAVKKMWPAVKIMVKKKNSSDEGKVYEVAAGKSFEIPGTKLTVEAGQYLPDFLMDGQTITSKSETQVNPTVRLKVLDGGKEVYQGWAFEKYPEAHAFEHPDLTVTLVTGVKAK
jgi:hypothetical protein